MPPAISINLSGRTAWNLARILVGKSSYNSENQRRNCCGAIYFPLHHQGPRRDAGQDRDCRSAHRRLCRDRPERSGGRQIRRRGDQQEGRHHGPAEIELLVEDFGQRRRHRRAENPQADRTRWRQLHHRRRQFRHRDRDGAGHQRKEGAAHRRRRPHRSDHRLQLQSGTCSGSATPPPWMPMRSPPR